MLLKVLERGGYWRESAYTPIKKLVGEKTPRNFEAMKRAVDKAAEEDVGGERRGVERVRGKKIFVKTVYTGIGHRRGFVTAKQIEFKKI